jgi:hypothetical protein
MRTEGIEPSTHRLKAGRSTPELRPRMLPAGIEPAFVG